MRLLQIPVFTTILWMASASSGFAQSGLGTDAQSLGVMPDLAELFRARPPMGDCPVGATDEQGILPAGSHLLHLGVPRFYRDYRRRLKLTGAQLEQLAKGQERALKVWATQQVSIDALEVRVWELTGARQPDFEAVEGVLSELEKARTSQRIQYIQAVREASDGLTAVQRTELVGS